MRLVPSLAVLAAATFTAAAAEAAVSNGTLTGTTAAKDPIGLTVSGSRVTSLYFEGVHMTCTDKDQYNTLTGQYRMQAKGRFRIGSSGKFTFKRSTHEGASAWTAAGRFSSKGTRATGTLTIKQRYNDQNYLDPKGTITCESGKLKFTVNRR